MNTAPSDGRFVVVVGKYFSWNRRPFAQWAQDAALQPSVEARRVKHVVAWLELLAVVFSNKGFEANRTHHPFVPIFLVLLLTFFDFFFQ